MNLVDLFPEFTDKEMDLLVKCWNRRITNKGITTNITVATLPFVDIDNMIYALKKSNRGAPEYYDTVLDKLITKLNRYKDDVVLESLGLRVIWKDP